MKIQKGKLYTMHEAAKIIGLCYRTIHYHVTKMKLGTRYGHTILLGYKDMKKLQGRETTPGRKKGVEPCHE